jgi:hypothetical protein
MGAPVDTGIENFEEAILKLSISDRAKLIGWISETMVEEVHAKESTAPQPEPAQAWPPDDLPISKDKSGKTPWYEAIDPPGDHLSDAEWEARVNAVAGLWSDLPDNYGDDIVSSRTISTREINLDD